MNYKMVFYTLGQILKVEAGLLILPLIVSFIYNEGTWLSFLIPILLLIVLGFSLTFKKPNKTTIYAREGFVIVGLSWLVMSALGAFPFVISGEIPNYIDAFFETVSGFTTTGASILTNVESLTKGMLFWRSFTHWIGGMGVMVFVLAILPTSDAKSIYILRAESPGPQVGKLVSKVKNTASILYIIYIVITLIEIIMLTCGDMNFYEAVVHSFATAGTGGFGIYGDSVASFSNYTKIVIGVFMVLFGVNFNMFFYLIMRNFKQVYKNEELRWYLIIIVLSTIIIAFNLFLSVDTYANNFGLSLLDSFFQVSSIITTTGFSTAIFENWPAISQTILVILMFIGASAGSTGGGLKVSRVIILFKSAKREIKKLLYPNSYTAIKYEGKALDEDVVKGVNSYFVTFMFIFFLCLVLISIDNLDFTTNFTAVAACINNIGPGLGLVGAAGNYSIYSWFSKIILSIAMLVGRLEIFPILILFYPKTYKR